MLKFEDLTQQDLQENFRWSMQVVKAYQEGNKHCFLAGIQFDHEGVLALIMNIMESPPPEFLVSPATAVKPAGNSTNTFFLTCPSCLADHG